MPEPEDAAIDTGSTEPSELARALGIDLARELPVVRHTANAAAAAVKELIDDEPGAAEVPAILGFEEAPDHALKITIAIVPA